MQMYKTTYESFCPEFREYFGENHFVLFWVVENGGLESRADAEESDTTFFQES